MNKVSGAAQLLPPPGTVFEGGFYVGQIRVDDVIYGLVVAPKVEGDLADVKWLDEYADVPNARSYCDGLANTIAMTEAGSALAKTVLDLRIGGFDDWYLPSRDELELLYRHLKPTTETNHTWRSGDNPSSVPAGYPYTEVLPAQTSAAAFQSGGAEAFEDGWYWSSTQSSRNLAWVQGFGYGDQITNVKKYEARARAVRRFKVQ